LLRSSNNVPLEIKLFILQEFKLLLAGGDSDNFFLQERLRGIDDYYNLNIRQLTIPQLEHVRQTSSRSNSFDKSFIGGTHLLLLLTDSCTHETFPYNIGVHENDDHDSIVSGSYLVGMSSTRPRSLSYTSSVSHSSPRHYTGTTADASPIVATTTGVSQLPSQSAYTCRIQSIQSRMQKLFVSVGFLEIILHLLMGELCDSRIYRLLVSYYGIKLPSPPPVLHSSYVLINPIHSLIT